MKIIIASLIILAWSGLHAQEVVIPEPEFTGQVLYVASADEGVDLEKQRAGGEQTRDKSSQLVGIGTSSIKNFVSGRTSYVRVNGNEPIRFIVRVENNGRDPREIINIFQLDREENRRSIAVTKSGTFSGSTSAIQFLEFKGKKYGESSYLVELSGEVREGEYALTLDGTRDMFNLFGVDKQ